MKHCLRFLSISIFLLLLFIALPSQAIYNEPVILLDNYQLAWEVFSKANTSLRDIKIQAWGQINNKVLTLEEISKLYEVIAPSLELQQSKPAVQIDNGKLINLSIIEEKERGEVYQLSIQTIALPGREGEGVTYLAILIKTQDAFYAQKTYNKLVGLLKKIGLQEPIGITLTGEISGIMSPAAKNARINELSDVINGSYVNGIIQEKYSSKCFFAKQAKESLDIQGKKVNFNIAICDDKNEGKTYLHVGVPLIYQDY